MTNHGFGKIASREIILNPMETAARLGTSINYSDSLIEDCRKTLMEVADCKYAWVRVPVYIKENTVNLGFGEFSSRDLAKALAGCDEAFIFAVTAGLPVERLLIKEELLSPTRHFVTDALASSLAEAICDEAEKRIKGTNKCKPRFSPGYGDLPLDIQPKVLKLLDAQNKLGISLNSALLMTPSKSITAIMGIYNEKV